MLITHFDLTPSGEEAWIVDKNGGISHVDIRENSKGVVERRRWVVQEEGRGSKLGGVSVNRESDHPPPTSSTFSSMGENPQTQRSYQPYTPISSLQRETTNTSEYGTRDISTASNQQQPTDSPHQRIQTQRLRMRKAKMSNLLLACRRGLRAVSLMRKSRRTLRNPLERDCAGAHISMARAVPRHIGIRTGAGY